MTHEINVTPLIDVMLVLLIIFMVVTPLSQKGLDVELPRTATPGDPAPSTPPLMLEMDGRGEVRLNRNRVAPDELPLRLRELLEMRLDKTLFLKADETLSYREVVAVLDLVRGCGVERVGVIRME